MTSRERGAQPGKGETDPVGAVAIARITMREPRPPPVRLAVGEAADLRALSDYRENLITERGELTSRVHADLLGLFPGYQEQITTQTGKAHLTPLSSRSTVIPGSGPNSPTVGLPGWPR